MALFKRKSAAQAPVQAKPTLVMREIFADAMPDGIEGDLGTLKDQLVAAERVHPFVVDEAGGKFAQLNRCRLANKDTSVSSDKHCYGLFEQETGNLRTVVYVNLAHAAQEADGVIKDSDLPGNIHNTLNGAKVMIDKPDTAIFYSISSMGGDKTKTANPLATRKRDRAVRAVVLATAMKVTSPANGTLHGSSVYDVDAMTPAQFSDGELLIRSVADHLQKAHGIKAFSTLSPMRSGTEPTKVTGFASWLKSQLSGENVAILTSSEKAFLDNAAQGTNYFERIGNLHQNYASLEGQTKKTFETLMEDLGTHYIAYARNKAKPDRPLDPVTGFHIGNGAKLANIHYLPSDQTTALDNAGSFGMVANYRYEPKILNTRKHIAKKEDTVPLTPAVAARYVARLEELGMPYKQGKRTAQPTHPVVEGKSVKAGNTLFLPADQGAPQQAAANWGERYLAQQDANTKSPVR